MHSSDKHQQSQRKTKSYHGCRRCRYTLALLSGLLTQTIGTLNGNVPKVHSNSQPLFDSLEKPACNLCKKAGVECEVRSSIFGIFD